MSLSVQSPLCPPAAAAGSDAVPGRLPGDFHLEKRGDSPPLESLHVVFAGGATAGHLMPGLAVAEVLRRWLPQVRLTFMLTGKPLERRLLAREGFAWKKINAAPWSASGWGALRCAASMLLGYRQAACFLRREQGCLVVSLGGYTAAPGALAAVRLGIPLVVLEQNAIPGRTTRAFAARARAVCLAMPEAAAHLPARCRVHLTGNPLRAGFLCARAEAAEARRTDSGAQRRSARPARLVVLGGSNGASWLNEHLPNVLAPHRRLLDGWQILHQTGAGHEQATRRAYADCGLEAQVVSFVDDMPAVLRGAELAICRAGATTLSELAAMGVPAVLIPYPHAADDHQLRNAQAFARAGAAVVVDQRDAPGSVEGRLSETLSRLLAEPETRRRMARAMARQARPDATRTVARLILSILARRATFTRAKAGGLG